MKRYASLILASALVSSLLVQTSVNAETIVTNETEEKEVQQEKFIKVIGTIEKLTEESKDSYYATVKSTEEEFGFYYNDATTILDNTGTEVELSEGMEITAYIDASKSMIMIYPPRYSPEVVIVQTEKPGIVELQRFNAQLLNKEENLVIKVVDETIIEDLSGNTLTKDGMIEKEVLIFFDYVLESYPAQTGPQKILVLENELSNIDKAIAIAETDHYEVNGVNMIPLRLVAEQLGFQVGSTGKGAIVSKGNVSFTITRGTTQYSYNKAIRNFSEKPVLLEERKTYVPYEFLELLIELSSIE
jgi:hypothetical protein